MATIQKQTRTRRQRTHGQIDHTFIPTKGEGKLYRVIAGDLLRRRSGFPREPTAAMEAKGSGLRRVFILAFCVAGIWTAYIYQGVLQETL